MESNGFCEVLVKVQPSSGKLLLSKVLWAMAIVSLLAGLLYLIFLLMGLVLLLPAFFYGRSLKLEYEYQFLDGFVRIDKIKNMSKRKKGTTFELENAILVAPVDHPEVKEKLARKEIKAEDYTSGDPNAKNRYAVLFSGNRVILLEPTEGMIRQMWRMAPSKVKRQQAYPG